MNNSDCPEPLLDPPEPDPEEDGYWYYGEFIPAYRPGTET